MKNKFQLVVNVVVMIMFASLLTGAGVLLRGTSGTDFTLDYDQTGAGASQTITFNRGSTGVIDAILTWNETSDQFVLNFPLQSNLNIFNQGTGQLTDGSAGGKTVSYMDDSPAGEYGDATGNGFVTPSDDATLFKMGSNSLKAAFVANAAIDDGVDYTTGQPWDWSSDENFGLWCYSSVALDAADLALEFDDDGGTQIVSFPIVAVTTWTWIPLDLPGADADKNVISELRFVQKVDKGAMDVYFDAVWKWDSTENSALTYDILEDGDHTAKADVTAGGAFTMLTRYTDYFISYDSTDNLVTISDQSTNKVSLLYTYE